MYWKTKSIAIECVEGGFVLVVTEEPATPETKDEPARPDRINRHIFPGFEELLAAVSAQVHGHVQQPFRVGPFLGWSQ